MPKRDTAQRRAIQAAIASVEHPLTPADILDAAQREVPALGIATVYRALKELVLEGEVVGVDLPGEATRYERAGKDHHHHFHCRRCGTVFEAEGCTAALNKLVPPGFVVEAHEVILYGRCAKCSRARAATR